MMAIIYVHPQPPFLRGPARFAAVAAAAVVVVAGAAAVVVAVMPKLSLPRVGGFRGDKKEREGRARGGSSGYSSMYKVGKGPRRQLLFLIIGFTY